MSLYLRLQSKLGLPMLDRWRLWRVACTLNIEHPTALLISEKLYDEAVQRYRRSPGRVGTAAQLASIRARLFETKK